MEKDSDECRWIWIKNAWMIMNANFNLKWKRTTQIRECEDWSLRPEAVPTSWSFLGTAKLVFSFWLDRRKLGSVDRILRFHGFHGFVSCLQTNILVADVFRCFPSTSPGWSDGTAATRRLPTVTLVGGHVPAQAWNVLWPASRSGRSRSA